MNKEWPEAMIAEMEMAWAEANKTRGGHRAREHAATVVAQRYFKSGMTRKEIEPLLDELKDHGFKISAGTSEFFVSKQHGRTLLIIRKHVSISLFLSDAGDVSALKARIWKVST